MRWLLIMLAVGAAGMASYLGTAARNSFSSYSSQQLDMLQQELAQQQASSRAPKASGKRAEQKELLADSQSLLLEQERQRRLFFYLALGAAALSGLASFLVRSTSPSAPSLRGSSDEDARLLAVVGDPEVLREGARQKAASLLGVTPEAPPAVIEAALQAQLQQRDPTRLEGLAPDLKSLVLKQREELVRARDLLLNKKPSDSRGG